MGNKLWIGCVLVVGLIGCSGPSEEGLLDLEEIRKLPEVASVEVAGASQPNLLVLHLLDRKAWNLGELELSEASLMHLETLQREQKQLLRQLALTHEVAVVGLGGVSDDEEAAFVQHAERFQKTLANLREGEQQIYRFEQAIHQAKKLGPEADKGMQPLLAALQETQENLAFESRMQSLQLGPLASLLDGSLPVKVLPLEDGSIYRQAVVIPFQSGKKPSQSVSKTRIEGMVQRILACDADVVAILVDGSVDLTEALPAEVGYWRIATREYQAFSSVRLR